MTDAHDTTPSKGNESSGTDHELQTDGGFSRRRFLGAAAALSALPALSTGRGSAATIKQQTEHYGATRTEIESGAPVSSNIELKEFYDTETEIQTTAYDYDDEPSEVELAISCNNAHVAVCCSPERAREVAAELELAADEAEGSR